MSNTPITQVAVSTIKGSAKEPIYPKTIDSAVITNVTDPTNGQTTTLDKILLNCKDKEYIPSSPNGLGRRILKKNIVNGDNILISTILSTPNTEYYIQYDFDLDGADITLPANLTLYFIGGSLKNGTLTGNNTRIVAKKGVMIFDNITIQGTWDVAEAYSSWFKMHKKGYKIKDVTEAAITLYKGTDNNYYDFDDLTLVGSDYYVTSTLEGGEVVESSIKVTATTYATFRVEGYNTDSTIDYVAAIRAVPGSFNADNYEQYDDTASLQSLLDIRAKKTVIEDGIYIIKADTHKNNNRYNGLYVDNHEDSELVLEGWLKVYPNSMNGCYALDVIGCDNFKISGKGGIHGDLLEHTGTGGEGGMNLAVAGTRNFVVESITTAYAWGDCIYSHWYTNGRPGTIRDNTMQKFHTYKNVKIIYGGRTGYGCERANNVVFDGCYFYGTGRVRGKATNSAVDIEPFNYSDTPERYVMNYEFKNNVFENSANGLRLERCVNCSIHDNYFNYGWSGINVIWHTDVSYDITSPSDRGWLKSRMAIYNNFFGRCSRGIYLGYSSFGIENIDIYNNTLVSCPFPITSVSTTTIKSCNVYDNTTYGCGQWSFNILVNTVISGNKNYGCKMPANTVTWGNATIFKINNFSSSLNSEIHHNYFFTDYGKSMLGLNADGKEEIYHGPPVGYRYTAVAGCTLTNPKKIYFHDNYIHDDFYVYYGSTSDYQPNHYFEGGMNSVRDESSEVFIKGDTFRSATYGDEGVVVTGGIISCSWLKAPEQEDVRTFEPFMEVAYGEVIKLDSYYKICNKGGVCGETLETNQGDCGTARFNTQPAMAPTSASANRIKISFKTRGNCTSETRPDSFLYAGRKMWETDTNKEIVFDGSDWVYNDIYTEE